MESCRRSRLSALARWLWIPGLLLCACGSSPGDDAQKANEAWAALRPQYEKRTACIDNAIAAAPRWRKGELAPIESASLGKAVLSTGLDQTLPAGANARLIEIGSDSQPNYDPHTFCGLLADAKWRKETAEIAKGGYLGTEGRVRRAVEDFLAVRYLVFLLTEKFVEPALTNTKVFSVDFSPGSWSGRFVLFDLEAEKLLGGTLISIANSDKIDFKTEGFGEKEQRENAISALNADLRKNLLASVAKATGAAK